MTKKNDSTIQMQSGSGLLEIIGNKDISNDKQKQNDISCHAATFFNSSISSESKSYDYKTSSKRRREEINQTQQVEDNRQQKNCCAIF